MKSTRIFIFMVLAVLSLLLHGAHGRKNRWGCSASSDCVLTCRRSCQNFLRPLCYSSQCYCQALSYPRTDYQRVNMGPGDPSDMYDYEIKQI